MIEGEGFADSVAVAVDDSGLVFVFSGINTDNEFAFDPVAFLVELILVHGMILSFCCNERIC